MSTSAIAAVQGRIGQIEARMTALAAASHAAPAAGVLGRAMTTAPAGAVSGTTVAGAGDAGFASEIGRAHV